MWILVLAILKYNASTSVLGGGLYRSSLDGEGTVQYTTPHKDYMKISQKEISPLFLQASVQGRFSAILLAENGDEDEDCGCSCGCNIVVAILCEFFGCVCSVDGGPSKS